MADQVTEIPEDIRQVNAQTLGITWKDGHESRYESNFLRRQCQCAVCVDEWTGTLKLDATAIPADIHPQQVRGVGRYAIRIDWSDGHNTGLYTFEFLRKICPCPNCKGE
jgi:DUF971 family protein